MVRALLIAFVFFALPAAAQAPQHEFVYGSQMMKKKERDEYRRQLAAAKDPQAERQVRENHRRKMDERAKQRGGTLDEHGVLQRK